MLPKRIADDGALMTRKPWAPKERPPGMTNTERLQASFEKCWADARAHNAGRDTKYDARWKEMLANQST
jgi:hypothetical protein